MKYVDGFVLPVPKKNMKAYVRMASLAGRIWREHGALEYRECAGDDLDVKFGIGFLKMTKLKPGETVVFAWIVFKSQAHRDRVNAKVMKDPRMNQMMEGREMPFDPKRMAYGGFKVLVDA
ncbi:MAG: DUF1428 domain-containing protein [Planctomycetales bacterium]|nr:DUF1428 domain-containing protein [Planctomycetales bacterium]